MSRRRYATVSAKIPIELKERIEKLGINVSQVIRHALEEEVRRRELERLRKLAEEVAEALGRIPDDEIVKIIREAREAR